MDQFPATGGLCESHIDELILAPREYDKRGMDDMIGLVSIASGLFAVDVKEQKGPVAPLISALRPQHTGAARLLRGWGEADTSFGGVHGVAALREDELRDQENGLVGRPDVGDVDRGAIRFIEFVEPGPVVGQELNDFDYAGLRFGTVAGARHRGVYQGRPILRDDIHVAVVLVRKADGFDAGAADGGHQETGAVRGVVVRVGTSVQQGLHDVEMTAAGREKERRLT